MGAAECDAGGQQEPFCPPFGSLAPVVQVIERVQDIPEEALSVSLSTTASSWHLHPDGAIEDTAAR